MKKTNNDIAIIYNEGYKKTLENSKNLYKSASLVSKNRNYGLALSLLILSAEEAMKAYAIKTQSLFPERKIKDFDKIFSSHFHKIENMRSIIGIGQIMQKMNDLYNKPVFEALHSQLENIETVKNKGTDELSVWLENEEKNENTELSIQDAWWKNANKTKQNGIYVSFKNGNWVLPDDFTQKQYIEGKKYVGSFLNFVKKLNSKAFNNNILISQLSNLFNKHNKT